MFPELILNCIASTALVVLPYPPTYWLPAVVLLPTPEVCPINCLTNVVELGSNKCKYPEAPLSASLSTSQKRTWSDVDCAKSAAPL